ncbi:MAG: hypothetical protein RR228_00505 [Bacilli bacterium]
MKKIIILISIISGLFILSGCGKVKNIEGTLPDLMTKVYSSLKDDEKPMMLMNTVVTKENASQYLGTDKIEFESALASESGVGSIPHSVVLLRAKKDQDILKLKKDIKASVNPRKWICVGVEEENVLVESSGNLVILIMDNEFSKELLNNFNKIK